MTTQAPRFWRSIPQRYNLSGTHCTRCNEYFFPPRNLCPNCRRGAHHLPRGIRIVSGLRTPQHAVMLAEWYARTKVARGVFTVLRGVDPTKPEEIFKKIGGLCRIEWDEANDAVNMPYWRMVG